MFFYTICIHKYFAFHFYFNLNGLFYKLRVYVQINALLNQSVPKYVRCKLF